MQENRNSKHASTSKTNSMDLDPRLAYTLRATRAPIAQTITFAATAIPLASGEDEPLPHQTQLYSFVRAIVDMGIAVFLDSDTFRNKLIYQDVHPFTVQDPELGRVKIQRHCIIFSDTAAEEEERCKEIMPRLEAREQEDVEASLAQLRAEKAGLPRPPYFSFFEL